MRPDRRMREAREAGMPEDEVLALRTAVGEEFSALRREHMAEVEGQAE